MIDGRERRPFAASRHVGRTKVRDDVDLERRRGTLAVAELPRKACARSMQDGLAVQADESDALAGNRKPVKERLDRGHMGGVGHQALELELRRLGFSSSRRPPPAGAARPRAGRKVAEGPVLSRASPSLSISATSMPSIEVPLMTPIAVRRARGVRAGSPSRGAGRRGDPGLLLAPFIPESLRLRSR